MTDSKPAQTSHSSRRRRWGFRVAAVLLGLSIFPITEGVCIIADWGRPTNFDDPFVGFSDIHPLFVPNSDGTRYEIPKSRRKFFATESFPAQKGKQTFRVFCLGGSTVQGRPYSTPTSFTTWLRLGLQAADSGRDWEVINCGGISYASYRLVPILSECLTHNPDLIVICTGHNEFLEDRTYDHIKRSSKMWVAPTKLLGRFRSYSLLRAALQEVGEVPQDKATNARPQLPAEVDALLDYNNSLIAYQRDESWRAGVIEHFENNLRRMVAIAHEADIPVILIRPPANLCDTPPFKSQHRDGMTEEELSNWDALREEARSKYRDNLPEAVSLLNQAIAINDEYAAIHFELGKCFESLAIHESARKSFVRAKELDICPLRILEPMGQIIQDVSKDYRLPLIDAHALLESRCPHGILGDHRLVDHVHPSITGHQEIADEIVKTMAKMQLVRPVKGWQVQAKSRYQQHFDSLETIYFLHGQQALESLRAWTQGRADGPPIESRINLPRAKPGTGKSSLQL